VRGSAARALLPGLAVLALVAVVAVAATGGTPSGTSDGRRPPDVLLDSFFSLALVALVPAAALLVYGLLQRKEIARELASGRYPRATLAAWIVFVSLLTLAAYLGYRGSHLELRGPREVADLGQEQGRVRVPDVSASDPDAYQAEFAWGPVLAAVALAALGALALFAASRRRRLPRTASAAAVAEQLAAALDDTLDDLWAEPDPRRAVIGAYARLERALAASGLPRLGAETAQEYLARILERLEVAPDPARRLTELFVEAKFSQHAIDQTAKDRAIAALAHVRDELRQAAQRREQAAPVPSGQVASA